MAGAFGALMTRVLSRVPVAIAADASGVIVTVNQLGIVVGIATFGTLYLNLAGRLPAAARRRPARPLSRSRRRTPTWPCRSRSPCSRCSARSSRSAHMRVTARHALAAARQ